MRLVAGGALPYAHLKCNEMDFTEFNDILSDSETFGSNTVAVTFIIERLCECALADDEAGVASWSTVLSDISGTRPQVAH